MNRSIQRSLIAGMVAMAFAAGTALAAGPERDPGQQSPTSHSNMSAQQSSSYQTSNGMSSTSATAQAKFSELDTNGDGVIDQQEAKASKALSAEFKKLDANNDGKLSMTEFSAAKNLASIKIDNKKSTKGY